MAEPTPNGLPKRRSLPWHKHWNTMRHDLAVKQLNDRVYRRWTWILELAGSLDEDGFVSNTILRVEGITNADASDLIVSGLCEPAADGIQITNWARYQTTRSERAAAAERQQKSRSSRG